MQTPTWAWLHCRHAPWGQRTDSIMIMAKLLAVRWLICSFSMTMELHGFYEHPWNCSKVTLLYEHVTPSPGLIPLYHTVLANTRFHYILQKTPDNLSGPPSGISLMSRILISNSGPGVIEVPQMQFLRYSYWSIIPLDLNKETNYLLPHTQHIIAQ